MNINYLGPKGSYSYSLVKKIFPNEKLIPVATFNQIVNAVKDDEESIGVLGIENSISSSIHENVDLIFNNDVSIIGEACMDIQLHLIGIKGSTADQITDVFSYPQAIAQCSEFIQTYKIKIHDTPSTMAAVGEVETLQDKTKGAIAGNGSLASTSLSIIQANIGNESHNMTRWIFISKKIKTLFPHQNKITFIFKVKHEPGSLVRVLQAIADAKGNMSKIESRPQPGSNWEYLFWIDVEIPEGTAGIFEEIMARETLAYRTAGLYEKGQTYHE